jgi:hypothetical protein
MAVEDTVELLALYVEDNGKTMADSYGPEAVAAAEDMVALISARLEDESAYAGLWESFSRAPYAYIEELMGALEAHIEGDPSLARIVGAYLREIRGEIGAPGSGDPMMDELPRDEAVTEFRGDALDSAVSLDARETEQDQLSYHPEIMSSGNEYDDSVDRGTYLYGDLEAGQVTLGQEAGVDTIEFGDPTIRPTELAAESRAAGVFENLYIAVEDHPAMGREQKREARDVLEALEEALRGPEAADETYVERHLRKLQEMEPDIAEILIEILAAIELPESIQKAVEDLRSQPSDEGQTTYEPDGF